MATKAPLLGGEKKGGHSKASIFYGADEYLEELKKKWFRVASHEGHQIRAKRQFPSLRQLATLAFPQLWRFIAGGDDTQADQERPKFPPWTEKGHDVRYECQSAESETCCGPTIS
eukprot:symbB.v1.2.007004.t1/scaffold419.1/size210307/10